MFIINEIITFSEIINCKICAKENRTYGRITSFSPNYMYFPLPEFVKRLANYPKTIHHHIPQPQMPKFLIFNVIFFSDFSQKSRANVRNQFTKVINIVMLKIPYSCIWHRYVLRISYNSDLIADGGRRGCPKSALAPTDCFLLVDV